VLCFSLFNNCVSATVPSLCFSICKSTVTALCFSISSSSVSALCFRICVPASVFQQLCFSIFVSALFQHCVPALLQHCVSASVPALFQHCVLASMFHHLCSSICVPTSVFHHLCFSSISALCSSSVTALCFSFCSSSWYLAELACQSTQLFLSSSLIFLDPLYLLDSAFGRERRVCVGSWDFHSFQCAIH
jgi:hypothetical protein